MTDDDKRLEEIRQDARNYRVATDCCRILPTSASMFWSTTGNRCLALANPSQ